ncbi:MAG: serine hydrolase, partial [Frankiales bacterium]|nr:serine hydrolase [Frankiales bacterium]
LPDSTRLLMQQQRAHARSGVSGTGVSWLLQQRGDLRLVTHGGNVNNLQVGTFVLVPDERLAVLVLSSSRGGHEAGRALVDAVLEDLGHPTPPPLPEVAAPDGVVGSYDGGAWQQQITLVDGRLHSQMVLPPDAKPELLALFAAPPTELVAVGVDQLATAARPWDVIGDIGRAADGRVAWLRWGMRVFPRVEGEQA